MGQSIYRALVVDDEPLIREVTARAMSAHRFCCDTASNGHEALQKYRDRRHELVVTDLRMPGMHGHSLILELLKDREPPHIVVMTGVSSPDLTKDLLRRGVQNIAYKPVDLDSFAPQLLSIFEQDEGCPIFRQGESIHAGGASHPLVIEIEKGLELLSLGIPPELDRVLSVGADYLDEPPSTVMQFMERLLQKRKVGLERRGAVRISLLTTAVAVPVSKNFVPQAEACKMTFNDISQTGACLFHTRSVQTKYLALRWRSLISPNNNLQVVMRITRCRPLGPFYEVAGEFVMHDQSIARQER
ncbi:MAG: response regulator [Pirellulales bacterium]|nr:response regulator [Pirellulales bacterium]